MDFKQITFLAPALIRKYSWIIAKLNRIFLDIPRKIG